MQDVHTRVTSNINGYVECEEDLPQPQTTAMLVNVSADLR